MKEEVVVDRMFVVYNSEYKDKDEALRDKEET